MSNCRDVIPLYFNNTKATLHIYYESQGEEQEDMMWRDTTGKPALLLYHPDTPTSSMYSPIMPFQWTCFPTTLLTLPCLPSPGPDNISQQHIHNDHSLPLPIWQNLSQTYNVPPINSPWTLTLTSSVQCTVPWACHLTFQWNYDLSSACFQTAATNWQPTLLWVWHFLWTLPHNYTDHDPSWFHTFPRTWVLRGLPLTCYLPPVIL
jgi:hypothetical protein